MAEINHEIIMPEEIAEQSPKAKSEKLVNVLTWTYSEEFGPFEGGKEFKNPGIPQDHVDRAIMDGLLKIE
jgi:hypothetical protein